MNMAVEGGLYAEQIWNRDFEALGRHMPQWAPPLKGGGPARPRPGSDLLERAPIPGDMRPWRVLRRGKATVRARIATDSAPFPSNPHVLRVSVNAAPGGEGGIVNPGYLGGIGVTGGEAYKLTFWAASPSKTTVTARLRTSGEPLCEAQVELGCTPDQWCKYRAKLAACKSSESEGASFELVIAGGQNATAAFDGISLFPSDAVAGIFNAKILAALKQLHPAFVRAPSGYMITGTGPRSRWRWNDTVGDWLARPGHYSTSWGYWVTDGMGLLEYLTLGEVLGARSVVTCSTGYAMGPDLWLSRGQYWISAEAAAAEAVGLMNYAAGSARTAEGRLRTEHGRSMPFPVPTLEVGHEEPSSMQYAERFRAIAYAVRRKYIGAAIIAGGAVRSPLRPPTRGPATRLCASGSLCSALGDRLLGTPDEVAALSTHYDRYNRSLPEVWVTQLSACGAKCLSGTWGDADRDFAVRSAIAEAAFLTGAERNGDVVRGYGYASVLGSVQSSQWRTSALRFDPVSGIIPSPSFFMLRLWAKAKPYRVLVNTTVAGPAVTHASAVSVYGGGITARLVNYSPRRGSVTVSLDQGLRQLKLAAPRGEVFAHSTLPRTLPEPQGVGTEPVEVVSSPPHEQVTVSVRPYSLTVVTWPLLRSALRGGQRDGLLPRRGGSSSSRSISRRAAAGAGGRAAPD